MKTQRLTIVLGVATVGLLLLSFANGDQTGNTAKTVEQLQRSRIAVFEELLEIMSLELEQGGVTEQDVFDAEVMLLEAKANATSDAKERIDLLEQKVRVLSKLEAFQKISVELGRCSQRTLLLTKAQKIEAQIAVQSLISGVDNQS